MSSWYRLYRPRQVSELHLSSVRETMEHLMRSGRFPQALLFAGPKGTGKTSTARIIGAMLNDPKNAAAVEQLFLTKTIRTAKTAVETKKTTPVLQEPDPDSALTQQICAGQSFAVIEIDAASQGLVDDVRLLKDRAQLSPQLGLMTVYILDEVHMMSTAAFNALLKLLEEPPAHAVFILATTELHKIPATIASRCTLVPFRKALPAEIKTVFERILKTEKITAEPEALDRLAELADGSFRDAVKWLELSATDGKITVETVTSLIGGSLATSVPALIQAVVAKDAAAVTAQCAAWREQQVDQTALYRAVMTYLHQQLLSSVENPEAKTAITAPVAQFLLQQLLTAQLHLPAPIPYLALELKFLELIQKSQAKTGANSTPSQPTVSPPVRRATKVEKTAEDEEEEVAAAAEQAVVAQAVAAPVIVATVEACQKLIEQWPAFITAVANQNTSVAAFLRQAQPKITAENTVLVQVFYQFHLDQLKQQKFATMLHKAVETVIGQTLSLEFAVTTGQPAVAGVTTGGSITPASEPSLRSLATQALM